MELRNVFMNDRLQIIRIYKKILKDVYLSMINIPRIHYSLKEFIISEMYHYLEDLYLANDIEDKKVRLIKKEELVIRIKYISSLIGTLNEFKVLGEKKYLSIYQDLELLLRLLKSWKNV